MDLTKVIMNVHQERCYWTMKGIPVDNFIYNEK